MKGSKKKTNTEYLNRINNEIQAKKVRLIGLEGEKFGVLSLEIALEKAEELGSDLVEISANSEPPVCRIMNYGKFLYKKNKSLKEQRKKQKNIQIKEIKFRPNTNEKDYQVKLRSLIRFLKENDKTKITIRFRGREIAHQKIGIKILNRVKNDLQELAIVEFFSTKIEGRQMIMILAPKKNKYFKIE